MNLVSCTFDDVMKNLLTSGQTSEWYSNTNNWCLLLKKFMLDSLLSHNFRKKKKEGGKEEGWNQKVLKIPQGQIESKEIISFYIDKKSISFLLTSISLE